jgi:hypothetical protein
MHFIRGVSVPMRRLGQTVRGRELRPDHWLRTVQESGLDALATSSQRRNDPTGLNRYDNVALSRELDRVAHDIDKYLPQAGGITDGIARNSGFHLQYNIDVAIWKCERCHLYRRLQHLPSE